MIVPKQKKTNKMTPDAIRSHFVMYDGHAVNLW